MKGMRVPPQSFLFKYKTADNAGRYKELLVVFCDIPGEDTGAVRGLRASGFYLKYVDGILALLDSTRLVNVAPFMKGEADAETNADASGGNAMRAVGRDFHAVRLSGIHLPGAEDSHSHGGGDDQAGYAEEHFRCGGG